MPWMVSPQRTCHWIKCMHPKFIFLITLLTLGLADGASAQLFGRNRGANRPFARFQERVNQNQASNAAEEQKPTPPTGAPRINRNEIDYSFDRRNLPETVNKAIGISQRRMLSTHINTPWQILHGMLALRNDYQLRHQGRPVNALEYLSNGARFKGAYWFEKTAYGGRAHPYNGTMWDFEGHVNQSLALIAMSNPPLSHKFTVQGGETITMQDMVNHAKMMVNTKEEITWSLWFLTHYVDQDEEWTNAYNQYWSMEQLVAHQTRFEPTRAPCGGTHGLFALAYARNAYLQKHGQLRGAWLEADQKLQHYVAAAKSMQNRDGSFSTGFFKSTGYSRDVEERLKTSGHMLEWLMMALPKAELEKSWVESAVNAVAIDLIRSASQNAECGALYHSLHALVLYRQRMMPESVPQPETLAEIERTPVGEVVSTKPDGEAAPNVVEEEPKPSIVMQPTKVAQRPTEPVTSATTLPLPPQDPVATEVAVDTEQPVMTSKPADEEPLEVAVNPENQSQQLLPVIKPESSVQIKPEAPGKDKAPPAPGTEVAIRVPQKPALAERLPESSDTSTTSEPDNMQEVTTSDTKPIIALPKGLLPILKPQVMAGAPQDTETK